MKQFPPNLGELWTQSQFCQFVDKSEAWAERGRVEGYGPPFIRIGRSIRYAVPDVMDWLNRNRRTSTSDRGIDE